ncbi:MAG: hypothetical protein ABIG89_06665 [Candidatus Woesearchaeota archaeon]
MADTTGQKNSLPRRDFNRTLLGFLGASLLFMKGYRPRRADSTNQSNSLGNPDQSQDDCTHYPADQGNDSSAIDYSSSDTRKIISDSQKETWLDRFGKTASTLMKDYEYEQVSFLENDIVVEFNQHRRRIRIRDFFDKGFAAYKGNCKQLTAQFYSNCKTAGIKGHILRVIGNDPNYFRNTRHDYLLVVEPEIMIPDGSTDDKGDIEQILGLNPLIVDPSFGVVRSFNDSGYKINKVYDSSVRMVYYTSLIVIQNYESVPLMIDNQGRLILLSFNFDVPSVLNIGIIEPRKMGIGYDRHSKEIDNLVGNDPRAMQYIERIRSLKVKETTDELEQLGKVII